MPLIVLSWISYVFVKKHITMIVTIIKVIGFYNFSTVQNPLKTKDQNEK